MHINMSKRKGALHDAFYLFNLSQQVYPYRIFFLNYMIIFSSNLLTFSLLITSNARLWTRLALSRRIDIFRLFTNYLFTKL